MTGEDERADLVELLDQVYEATTTVVTGGDDVDLDRVTRCAGWTARDLLFHLMCDAQRALVVFTTAPAERPDTTAVTYWSDWQPGQAGAEAHAAYVARAAGAYGSPHWLVEQWTETSRAAVRAARAHDGRPVATQGHILTSADFVHTLIVEGVVHHVDLTVDLPSPGLPEAAYDTVVDVLAGLLGHSLPAGWTAPEAVLKGTGRKALSPADRDALGPLADRFPIFG